MCSTTRRSAAISPSDAGTGALGSDTARARVDKITPIEREEMSGELALRQAQKLSPDSSGSIATSRAASQHRSAGVRRRPASSKMSSSSAGPIRKGRGRICERCCLATMPMTASSSMPAVWAQECPTRCSPICGVVLSR